MAEKFDLVAVGTGTAASGVARRCRATGWQVAVIDSRPFGGTCVLRGCDPKKVLRRGAEVIDAARLMQGKGIVTDGLSIDWPALVRFKREFTEPVPEQREEAYAKAGIAAFHGTARFVDERRIEVNGATLEARHILIASGAYPAPLPIPGAEHLKTSDDFLELDRLPPRIAFIGAGYISFEFAHMAARAGAEVVMLEMADRVLPNFDPNLVDLLIKRSESAGIEIHRGVKVEELSRDGHGFRLSTSGSGGVSDFTADLVFHGAGRIAALDDLDIAKGGVRGDQKGVEVNDYLQSTSNPAVYAAGDAAATPGPPLTPVASLEAEAAARNMLEGNHHKPDYTGIPSAVFTVPALTRVGLLEAEAEEQGLDFDVRENDMSGWYSSRRIGESCAAAKVLVENGSERILGAHVVGPESVELINVFGLAMRLGIVASDLKRVVSAYPSFASDLSYLI